MDLQCDIKTISSHNLNFRIHLKIEIAVVRIEWCNIRFLFVAVQILIKLFLIKYITLFEPEPDTQQIGWIDRIALPIDPSNKKLLTFWHVDINCQVLICFIVRQRIRKNFGIAESIFPVKCKNKIFIFLIFLLIEFIGCPKFPPFPFTCFLHFTFKIAVIIHLQSVKVNIIYFYFRPLINNNLQCDTTSRVVYRNKRRWNMCVKISVRIILMLDGSNGGRNILLRNNLPFHKRDFF